MAETVPWTTRARVGAAPEGDRVAAVQALYPAARVVKLGDEILIFRPGTTAPMVYREANFSLDRLAGDIASVAVPAIAGAVGGIGGGIAGLPGGPVVSALSAGAGATAGEELASRLLSPVDTRGAGQQAVEAATSMGVNTVAPGVGSALGRIPAALARIGGRNVGQQADSLQIPLTAGTRTGSPILNLTERIASTGVGGNAGINAAWQRSNDAADQAMRRIADQMAGRPVVSGSGPRAEFARQGAVRTGEGFERGIADRTYQTTLAFGGAPIPLTRTQAIMRTLESEATGAGGALDPSLQGAIAQARSILSAPNPDISTLLRLRTQLNAITTHGVEGQRNPVGNPALERLNRALRQDLDTAAAQRPGGQQALNDLDTFINAGRDRGHGFMTTIERAQGGSAEDLVGQMRVQNLLSNPGDLNRYLTGFRTAGDPQAEQTFRGMIVRDMGRPPPSRQGVDAPGFSFATFRTNYNQARDNGALDLVAPARSPERHMLDRLADVAENAVRNASEGNPSGTGRIITGTAQAGALGGGAAHAAMGGGFANLGMAALGALSPAAAAYTLGSPAVARWFTAGLNLGGDPRLIGQHIVRLGAIAASDPIEQGVRDQFRTALMNTEEGRLAVAAYHESTARRGEEQYGPPQTPAAMPPGMLSPPPPPEVPGPLYQAPA